MNGESWLYLMNLINSSLCAQTLLDLSLGTIYPLIWFSSNSHEERSDPFCWRVLCPRIHLIFFITGPLLCPRVQPRLMSSALEMLNHFAIPFMMIDGVRFGVVITCWRTLMSSLLELGTVFCLLSTLCSLLLAYLVQSWQKTMSYG